MARPRSRSINWLAPLALLEALALVLVLWSRAEAHDALTSSTPARNAGLAGVPTELRLTFSNPVALALARVTLLGPDSTNVPLGALGLHPDSARVLIAPIAAERLLTGRYTVQWQIAGADGHPVRGSFAFTILPDAVPPASSVLPERDTTPPADTTFDEHAGHELEEGGSFDAESPLYAAIRWLGFVGILGVIGAVGFRALVVNRMYGGGDASDAARALGARAARLGLLAAILVGIGTALRLAAQAAALRTGESYDASIVGAILGSTTWGTAWVIEAAAVVVAIAGFLAARRSSWGWPVAALGAVALAISLALTGHSASAERAPLVAPAVEVLHVLAAGGWIGTLLVLVGAGLPAILALPADRRGSEASAMVAAFSPAALAFAGLAVATGVFATWVHAGLLPSLATPYGRTLAIKVAAFLAVAAVGAWNWKRVRPKLGDAAVVSHLRRSATIELVAAAVVLAVTAVLVATPPPGH